MRTDLKYLFYLPLGILGITACHSKRQYPYVIKLETSDCIGCKAILRNDFPPHRDIDSATSISGTYVLKGVITQPGMYTVSCLKPNAKSRMHMTSVYLPADSISVYAKPNPTIAAKFRRLGNIIGTNNQLFNTQVVSTAPAQQEFEAYLFLRDSLWNKYLVDKDLVTAIMVQTFDSHNNNLIEQWADSARKFNNKFDGYMVKAVDLFVHKYPQSEVALYVMNREVNNKNSVRFQHYYLAMPDSLKKSVYGMMLKEKLEDIQSKK